MKPALALSVLSVALTASLVPALAGGSGSSSSDSETPPVTTITAGPAGPTNVTSAEFMFTADQKEVHFFCALDSPISAPCASRSKAKSPDRRTNCSPDTDPSRCTKNSTSARREMFSVGRCHRR